MKDAILTEEMPRCSIVAAPDTRRESTAVDVSAIRFSGYSFSYAGADTRVLSNIDFSIAQGSFTILCGPTGSGKSTLLRAMKPELAVAGKTQGFIRILGDDPSRFDPVASACRVGFVMQDPENQLVTDTVWHELAFGLENIGTEQQVMRRRVAETAHFFGIGAWFDNRVKDLSGGQKQLLNLAAVVVMQPRVLVLDEPTSQLDPIAAKDFFDVLERVNAELGITVVIIEHRLEDVLPLADHVLYLTPAGTLSFDGTPEEFVDRIVAADDPFLLALPAATRISRLFGRLSEKRPVTVKQGRRYLAARLVQMSRTPSVLDYMGGAGSRSSCRSPEKVSGDVVLKASDVWFRYDRDEPFVLRGVDIEVRSGQLYAIVGGNGSGKSTLLSALAGVRKAERGRVRRVGDVKVALMAQNPKTLFVCDTLLEDLCEWQEYGAYDIADVDAMMARFDLSELGARHPYDLSGGEMQKAALAKVLLLDPDVLLLDEPVKGIDAVAKREIAQIFEQLAEEGKAVLFTAHDLEFVADVAQTCSMMFGYDITCTQECHGFFQDNLFYSTATSRITRGILDGCVTVEDVAAALGRGDGR